MSTPLIGTCGACGQEAPGISKDGGFWCWACDKALTPRQFWGTMRYRCDRCQHVVVFYLEDGCEGPRGGGEVAVSFNGESRPWPLTPSGRFVVPVPFIAAGCPRCQGAKPWSMRKGAGCLTHVDWNRDETFPALVTDVPPTAGKFLYPPDDPRRTDANGQWPCGDPILPVSSTPEQPKEAP